MDERANQKLDQLDPDSLIQPSDEAPIQDSEAPIRGEEQVAGMRIGVEQRFGPGRENRVGYEHAGERVRDRFWIGFVLAR